MSDKLSIAEWAVNFDNGKYDSTDVRVQIDAGWYDWFCRDSSLHTKTKVLGKKVKQLLKSDKINPDSHYVFFKNNCAIRGSLYDDFRICDRETGDVVYCVVPRSGHKQDGGSAQVFGKENEFETPLCSGTWKDIKKFFGV